MRTTHRFYTVFLILILLIAFWLRLDDLDSMPPGISTDESFNVADSFILAHTGHLPLYEDLNRPEHLHRIILAAGTLFGSSVWAFRVMQVFAGLITVALADWTTRQCLRDLPRPARRIAGLAAAGSLAVAMSHMVLSRSLYRGLWLPLWILLFTGFLMRGLHAVHRKQIHPRDAERARENKAQTEVSIFRGEYRDFVLSGIALGLALHTYTAALVLPAALPVVALSLLIFRFKRWRDWLPGLIGVGVALAIVTAPISYMLVTAQDRVLTRANDVESGLTWDNVQERFERGWKQITERGDINSQYNADYAPILPPAFDLLFSLGLLALIVRLRHPSSALLAILVPLGVLPVIMAGEIPHGLRIAGEFGVFPVVIGVGVGAASGIVTWLANRAEVYGHTPLRKRASTLLYFAVTLALIGLTVRNARDIHTRYRAWWDNNDHPWEVYGRDLTHGDWFFRTDHRDLGMWLSAQQDPLLVPVSAISPPTMRAWLQSRYPTVTTSAAIPLAGTTDTVNIVIPWALEVGDLWRNERQFALLHEDMITLLPPLTPASHAALLAGIDGAGPVYRTNGDLLLETRPAQVQEIAVEPRALPNDSAPLAVFDDSAEVTGWRGPDTLDARPAADTRTYTLDFSATQNAIPHYYSAFVQLHTQDYQRLTGDEKQLLRWLYPPPLWQTDDVIAIPFTLDVPPDLAPGAYRLVVGLYRGEYTFLRVPVTQAAGETPDDMATIGWIKVPQPESPALDDHAVTVDAVIVDTVTGDQQFALIGGSAEQFEPGKIRLRLTWQALVSRPPLDATIFVHVLDAGENFVTQSDSRPWNGQYPTFIWDADEIVQTEHILEIGDVPLEDLHLIAGMYIFVEGGTQRLDVVQDGESIPGQFITLGDLTRLVSD